MTAAFDPVIKAVALLAAIFYAVGLLVVNTYLYSLDVFLADPSLLKARFIYTGGTALAVSLLVCVPPAYALFRDRKLPVSFSGAVRQTDAAAATTGEAEPDDSATTSAFSRTLLLCAGLVLPFAVLVAIIRIGVEPPSNSDVMSQAVAVQSTALVMGAGVLFALYAATGRGKTKRPRWSAVLSFTFVAAALTLGYIAAFGSYVYPALPSQFGGGRPQEVRFVFANDGAPEAHSLQLAAAGSVLSYNTWLLFNGTDFVVVRRGDGAVVEISKQIIEGTAHASR
jgi:hypothetical protein